MAATTQLTIEDFERLPADEARNHELVDGELIEMSGNTLRHNDLRDFLIELLRPLVRGHGLGTVLAEQEYDFDGNAHGPDVSFFGTAKQPLADPRKRVQRFVPDLAIEIISQSDTFESLWRKKDRYRRCGTREVWIISLETEEVFVYAETGNHILSKADELRTDLLPGFSTPVAALFVERPAR
jgi:Uma2 family endonuclease